MARRLLSDKLAFDYFFLYLEVSIIEQICSLDREEDIAKLVTLQKAADNIRAIIENLAGEVTDAE